MTKLAADLDSGAGETLVKLDEALDPTPSVPFIIQIGTELMLVEIVKPVRMTPRPGGYDEVRDIQVQRAINGTDVAGHDAEDDVFVVRPQLQTEANPSPPSESDGGGGGGLSHVTVALSSAQIATMRAVPIEVVPAPGAGLAVIPILAFYEFAGGTIGFASAGDGWALGYGPDENDNADDLELLQATSPVLVTDLISMRVFAPQDAEIAWDDMPLLVGQLDSDPGFLGPILTSHVATGGAGYAVNDTITLDRQSGTIDPVVTVDSVDGGGAVLTYHVSTNTDAARASAQLAQGGTSGGGDGEFELAIDTITPASDGTARVTVYYVVHEVD